MGEAVVELPRGGVVVETSAGPIQFGIPPETIKDHMLAGGHPPTIYAAGHDHNLQLLESGDVADLYVVSGAGARDRVSTVTNIPETIFAHAAEGFVIVDFGTQKGQEAVVLRVIEPVASPDAPAFEMALP